MIPIGDGKGGDLRARGVSKADIQIEAFARVALIAAGW
jgi:hypothetical protein